MGNDRPEMKNSVTGVNSTSGFAPYPTFDPKYIENQQNMGTFVGMGSQSESGLNSTSGSSLMNKSVTFNSEKDLLPITDHNSNHSAAVAATTTTMPPETNPYISSSPVPSSASVKETMETVRDVVSRWSKRVGEATKKAEDLAGNVWQHLKTAPSVTDAAMGMIAQSTKVLAEGGYEKVFQQSFETVPEEQLQSSYACYLSTSAGPVMGTLYLSTAKIAFCSDNPLSYKVGSQTEWSYYKVSIPLHQLKAVTPSASKTNPAEKYIQIASVDGHEFWFMGFVNYTSAVKYLQDALQTHNLHSV
ncbi:hypothetical protein MKW98_013096 [Papaver atlanticum]|uniref:GRAM domain-containing protein n=1 Tax=Papaver atlanticum TaxID=357466 RepID=A0AAD4XT61_9MAGN|nr:hypothetical protein MKW98_013096 [Papaver atlanticum]